MKLKRNAYIIVGEQRIILDCLEPESMVIYRNAFYPGKFRVHIEGYRRFVAEETIWPAVNDEVNLALSRKVPCGKWFCSEMPTFWKDSFPLLAESI